MKNFALATLTVPTIVVVLPVTMRMLAGWPRDIPLFLSFIPLLGFTVSVALTLVFPNSKQWKLAVVVNAIPLALVLMVGLLFWIVGYNG